MIFPLRAGDVVVGLDEPVIERQNDRSGSRPAFHPQLSRSPLLASVPVCLVSDV